MKLHVRIDMVDVRTWSFTFAHVKFKKTYGMTVTDHRISEREFDIYNSAIVVPHPPEV